MQVSLISYTGHGHPDPLYAARLLAFTKNTRLNMTPENFTEFARMPDDDLYEEIEYMAGTIASSWEFVDLTFAINKVSRATAQQITRTRTASFAMQSQRVTDLRNVSWDNPMEDELLEKDPDGDVLSRYARFETAMDQSIKEYQHEVDLGLPLEDARDLLPIGVHCNLIAKYNLRSFVELVRKRDSLRVQGSYRNMVQQMRSCVIMVWPWAEAFFLNPQQRAIDMIEDVARELDEGGAMYKGKSGQLAKAADLLKGTT